MASDTSVIKSIQFTITPKPGSVTRPLSGNLLRRVHRLNAAISMPRSTGTIFLSVYGLYAGFANTVTLTYFFRDGSSKDGQHNRHNCSFHRPDADTRMQPSCRPEMIAQT